MQKSSASLKKTLLDHLFETDMKVHILYELLDVFRICSGQQDFQPPTALRVIISNLYLESTLLGIFYFSRSVKRSYSLSDILPTLSASTTL